MQVSEHAMLRHMKAFFYALRDPLWFISAMCKELNYLHRPPRDGNTFILPKYLQYSEESFNDHINCESDSI